MIQYAVVIERGKDGGYGAYLPDLPGCVAVAETEAEVRKLIREAVQIPVVLNPKTLRASFRIDALRKFGGTRLHVRFGLPAARSPQTTQRAATTTAFATRDLLFFRSANQRG